MKRTLVALFAVVALSPAALTVSSTSPPEAAPPVFHAQAPSADERVSELLALGAETYDWHCAVCHGETAGGIEEARLAFPPDERRCSRCHRPSNRVVQPLDRPFIDNDMFSIGEPPALHPTPQRQVTLAGSAAPEALFAYLEATMPRYDPGRLTRAEYWSLTAFLLELNGRVAELPQVAELATRE